MSITITNLPKTFTACGQEVAFDAGTFPQEALDRIFAYGLGRVFQDRVNSAAFAHAKATGAKWTDSKKRDALEAVIAKWQAGDFGSTRGESVVDPVTLEAVRLAEAEVQRATGTKTRKEMAADERAAKYVTISDKGAVNPNYPALREFIERNPKLGLMKRAQAIVDARNDGGDDISVSL